MNKKEVVCWGASGHAKSVVNALMPDSNIEVVGYLDDVNPDHRGEIFEGRKILGGSEQLEILEKQGVTTYVLGFGHCGRRIEVGELLTQKGYDVLRVIHPRAILPPDAVVGEGTVVLAGAIIDPDCTIGKYVIVNNGVVISHECTIDDGTHLCPGVNMAGRARVGRGCWIGIGSTIIDKVTIGDHVFIGAGTVVTKDVPSGYIAWGNPAKIIRETDKKF